MTAASEHSGVLRTIREQLNQARATQTAMPNPVHAAMPTFDGRLIGRESELAAIDRALDDATVRCISLDGPGGVGKSSILRAAAKVRLDRDEKVALVDLDAVTSRAEVLVVLAGQLSSHGLAVPEYNTATRLYADVMESIDSRAGIYRGAFGSPVTPSVTATKMGIWLEDNLGAEAAILVKHPATILASALVADLGNAAVVIFVDAFDGPNAKLLEAFERLLEGAPLLKIVVAGQRKLPPRWRRFGGVRQMPVEPLNVDEIRELLVHSGVPADKADEVYARTEGFPLGAAMAAEALLASEDFELSRADELDILVAASSQLVGQKYGANVRQTVMGMAGVATFTRQLLAAIMDREIDESAWETLISLPFVRAVEGGFRCHDRVNALLVRSSLRIDEGGYRAHHLRAARFWLERNDPGRRLYHLAIGEPEEAIELARRLVMTAASRADRVAGAEMLAKLREAESNGGDRLLRSYSEALSDAMAGDWRASEAVLAPTSDMVAVDRPRISARAFELRAMVARYRGDPGAALSCAQHGLRVADGHGDADLKASLLIQIIELAGLVGRLQEARATSDHLATLLDTLDAPSEIVLGSLFHREHLGRWTGDWGLSIEALRAAAERTAQWDLSSGPTFEGMRLRYGLGRLLTFCGRYDIARGLLLRAREHARTLELGQHVAETTIGLSIVASSSADYETADNLLSDASDSLEEAGGRLYLAWVELNRLLIELRREPREFSEVARAQRLLDESHAIQYGLGIGWASAMLAIARCEPVGAAEDVLRRMGMRYEGDLARWLDGQAREQVNPKWVRIALLQGDVGLAAEVLGVGAAHRAADACGAALLDHHHLDVVFPEDGQVPDVLDAILDLRWLGTLVE